MNTQEIAAALLRALPLTNCSAFWIKRNDEMPERGERVIAFSPVYPKGHEMRFRILDGQFIRITTEVEYWAYCEPMADSLPNKEARQPSLSEV
jgi:hypothetical protein